MTQFKVKGDASKEDIAAFTEILDTYKGENSFIKDVLYKVEKYNNASAKQIAAVVKCYRSDIAYAEKNKARLARLMPIKEGKGEVIGEVVSIKQYESHWSAYTLSLIHI